MNIPTAKECAEHGVKAQIQIFVAIIGIGFHPDTDFEDYTDSKGKTFSARSVKRMNAQLQECFDMCDKYELDIYEITMEVIQPLLAKVATA